MAEQTLKTLAEALEQAAQRTQAQCEKDRLEAEWRTKKRPTQAQAEPEGLFAQTQGTLFDRTHEGETGGTGRV